jgi:hypothetical protein
MSAQRYAEVLTRAREAVKTGKGDPAYFKKSAAIFAKTKYPEIREALEKLAEIKRDENAPQSLGRLRGETAPVTKPTEAVTPAPKQAKTAPVTKPTEAVTPAPKQAKTAQVTKPTEAVTPAPKHAKTAPVTKPTEAVTPAPKQAKTAPVTKPTEAVTPAPKQAKTALVTKPTEAVTPAPKQDELKGKRKSGLNPDGIPLTEAAKTKAAEKAEIKRINSIFYYTPGFAKLSKAGSFTRNIQDVKATFLVTYDGSKKEWGVTDEKSGLRVFALKDSDTQEAAEAALDAKIAEVGAARFASRLREVALTAANDAVSTVRTLLRTRTGSDAYYAQMMERYPEKKSEIKKALKQAEDRVRAEDRARKAEPVATTATEAAPTPKPTAKEAATPVSKRKAAKPKQDKHFYVPQGEKLEVFGTFDQDVGGESFSFLITKAGKEYSLTERTTGLRVSVLGNAKPSIDKAKTVLTGVLGKVGEARFIKVAAEKFGEAKDVALKTAKGIAGRGISDKAPFFKQMAERYPDLKSQFDDFAEQNSARVAEIAAETPVSATPKKPLRSAAKRPDVAAPEGVKAEVDKANAKLSGGYRVELVQSEADLPPDARYVNVPGSVTEGVYLGGKTAYVVADSITDAKRAAEVIQHELAHMAAEMVLDSKEYAQLLESVKVMKGPTVRALRASILEAQPDLSPTDLAKEVLATAVERGIHREDSMLLRLVNKASDLLKRFAAMLGIESKYMNQAEVWGAMRRAMDGLEQGKVTQETSQAALRSAKKILSREYASEFADKVIYNFQNQFMDLHRMEAAKPASREAADPALAETLYSGVSGARTKDFHQDMRDPLLELANKRGIKYDQIKQHAHARHARERNKRMQEINPTQAELDAIKAKLEKRRDALDEVTEVQAARVALRKAEEEYRNGLADDSAPEIYRQRIARLRKASPEVKEYLDLLKEIDALKRIKPFEGDNTALSGMTNDEAEAILANAPEGMDEVMAKMDEIVKATRKVLVDGGLMTQEEADMLSRMYEHYVPLQREEAEGKMPSRGKGYSLGKGKEYKTATGSDREVVDPFAHLIAAHETAIVRAEKNKVDNAFARYLQENPDPEVAILDKVPMMKDIDPVTGLVVLRPDPTHTNKDSVIVFKTNGEVHTISFNERNVSAMRMAAAFKNLNSKELGEVTTLVGRATRMLAMLNTALNPVFLVTNFIRDLGTSFVNLSDTALARDKKAVFGDIVNAMRGWRGMLKNDYSGEWAKHAREFRDAGGQTGWLEFYKDIHQRGDALRKQLDRLSDTPQAQAYRVGKNVIDFIMDTNETVENAIRLSAFVNARRKGMSPARAAEMAKNLTVNFNRRGAKGVEMNMWYMFFNASVQGTARLLKAAKNKDVQKILGGIIASGFLTDMAARAMAGDDDDDGQNDYDQLAEHVKQTKMVIWYDDRPVTIPMPYGYNWFHTLGRKMSEMVFKEDASPTKAAFDLTSAFLGAFSPLGTGGGSVLQFVAPTVVDPFMQYAQNRNFSGRPIYQEQLPFGVPKPEYQMGMRATSAPSLWLSEILNDVTGGNEIASGWLNINPAVMDHIVTSMTGGAGRFLLQTTTLPVKLATGEEIRDREIPFWNIAMGATPQSEVPVRFYEATRSVELAAAEYKHYRNNVEMAATIREEKGHLLKLAYQTKTAQKALARIRDQLDQARAEGDMEKVKELNERRDAIMAGYLKRVDDQSKAE